MAVAVYISNESGATEVAIDTKSTKEICIVGHAFSGAVPVKIVSRTIPGIKVVRIVSIIKVTQGEIL